MSAPINKDKIVIGENADTEKFESLLDAVACPNEDGYELPRFSPSFYKLLANEDES